MTYRVLIFSMTFRRDFGGCYVLSKLLDHLGCETIVASNESYVSRAMRLWNPHAIILTSTRRAPLVRKVYPQALIFVYEGESTDIGLVKYELEILQDEKYYKNIERCYLRGNSMLELLRKEAETAKGEKVIRESGVPLDQKFVVVGNPHLDILKYHKRKRDDDRLFVGLVGFFHRINNVSVENVLKRILRHAHSDLVKQKWVERWEVDIHDTTAQIALLQLYCEIIEHYRSNDKVRFSIRPYPNENIKYYFESSFFMEHDVEIDTSLEFSSWFMEQDIIIGSTSSTSIQMAAAKKPYINVDLLINRPQREFMKRMLPTMTKYCPGSLSELHSMIDNWENCAFESEYFDRILHDDHNFPVEHSCLLSIAADVTKIIKHHISRNGISVPGPVVEFLSSLLKKRHKSRESIKSSYSYFDYNKIKTKIENEFDSVVDTILHAQENKQLLNNEAHNYDTV